MGFLIGVMWLAALVEIIDLIRDLKQKEIKKWVKWGLLPVKIFIIIALVWVSVCEMKRGRKKAEIESTKGELETATGNNISYPSLVIGYNLFQNANSTPLSFTSAPGKTIIIWKEGGKLFTNVYVKDADNNVIARIIESHWDILDSRGIDWNNDETAFELVTGDHKVIFQMELKGDVVYCNGFICAGKNDYYWLDKGIQSFTNSNGERFPFISKHPITTIFKYPRYKYLNVRNEIKK